MNFGIRALSIMSVLSSLVFALFGASGATVTQAKFIMHTKIPFTASSSTRNWLVPLMSMALPQTVFE